MRFAPTSARIGQKKPDGGVVTAAESGYAGFVCRQGRQRGIQKEKDGHATCVRRGSMSCCLGKRIRGMRQLPSP